MRRPSNDAVTTGTTVSHILCLQYHDYAVVGDTTYDDDDVVGDDIVKLNNVAWIKPPWGCPCREE